MKSLKLIIAGMAMFLAVAGNAQVQEKVNPGTPPPWGPAGYPDARYYYLPDVESYYDVYTNMFICYVEDAWVHKMNLPSRYKNYDLYDGYKVVMTDYYGTAPYKFFDDHKKKYEKGYRGPEQKTVGVKPGNDNPDFDNSQDDKKK
jgi:hypothetical protein